MTLIEHGVLEIAGGKFKKEQHATAERQLTVDRQQGKIINVDCYPSGIREAIGPTLQGKCPYAQE
ncbi:uncharacterized protein PHALS_11273 [Plasmopara halstedii]|uniref:Uncharacterized protein n=1 Tax=Plasmopara halstedii TaxID=4781 RepID=A0A0P1AKL1_PLAHL|nr:uncharacterized protein PHALS_11273 [Plasmopara halstedii]CEG41108.1 hypothetical protein PHALS_11273 [Plasmopara halstedii]|eukprot:XP_024577477.1 hypothetical protein PHALS_11273 [Plasmopara halstedii]